MIKTNHKIIIADSRTLLLPDNSINLIVTSPPYPMIKMWDKLFSTLNPTIIPQDTDFELMHQELDKIWREVYRVLKVGGIACINIGDATRSFDKNFNLYPNHARIIQSCRNIGFTILPMIHWHKQTNSPNKFLGSGTLPVGAYVTLEHEYILILRKGKKRTFYPIDRRNESAFFWEERNKWFSDTWVFKGAKQVVKGHNERTGAYPFELPYRLINMYSTQGDTVLDPFLGTGTTTLAAIASYRNSIGIEINNSFLKSLKVENAISDLNKYISNRFKAHKEFVLAQQQKGKELKYINKNHNTPVVTKHETTIKLYSILNSHVENDTIFVEYCY